MVVVVVPLLSYPSLFPGVCSNLCPFNQWCHPTISSSVIPFSSRLQSFPASGSFPMSLLFASGGQVLEIQLQHQSFQWIFSIDFLQVGLVWSSCSPRDTQESSPAPQFKSISSLALSLLYGPTLTSIHDYWKNHSFDYTDLCWQISLLFNMLSRFVIAFLPRIKCLLMLWLQSLPTVILEPKKIKPDTVSTFSPSICHKVMGPDAMIIILGCWVLSQLFHSPLSLSSRGSLVLLHFLP